MTRYATRGRRGAPARPSPNGYNHGNPPGWRPPPGQWYHHDAIDVARQAGRRGIAPAPAHRGRWAPAAGRMLTRTMLEAFGLLCGWLAVVAVARIGVPGLPRRDIAGVGFAVMPVAPLAAWWYAEWKRKRNPAGLAPAELAAAWAAPGILAIAAYRIGTGPREAWLLAAWAGWWLTAFGWVRIVRPPWRRAASYARTRTRRARAGAARRARPARGGPSPAPRDPLVAAARWAGVACRACAAGVARLVLGPLADEEDPDPVGDLDPGDPGGGRAWSPAPPREPRVRPSERRVPAYAGAVAGRERVRDPAPVPDAPDPEPAPAADPLAALAAASGLDLAGLTAAEALLTPGRVVTGTEAAGVLGKHRGTAARYLAALADAGFAERVGEGRGGRGSGFRAPSGS